MAKKFTDFLSKTPRAKKNRFGIQQYVKLEFSPGGIITTSRFYSTLDQEYVLENSDLPVRKEYLKQARKTGMKHVKIKDVWRLTWSQKMLNGSNKFWPFKSKTKRNLYLDHLGDLQMKSLTILLCRVNLEHIKNVQIVLNFLIIK